MVHPVLDDLDLPLVQEITTQDRRMLAEHKPPGMSGSLLQNLGRRPLRVVLRGVATGPDALTTVQKLDDKFRAAKPVPFVGDIVADAHLDLVFIEDLRLQELAGKPQRFGYTLTLREFIKPVDPAPATGLDTSILSDAADRIKGVVDGIAAAQALATGLEKFVPQFSALLARLQAAAKP
ncbi:hypothetical protein SAMN05519103_06776 [Rhizobiales bacterium GAS113]|nr:hypothetical protein SAMN05519103_06776 [Rhizobiales bacterium GAS113]